MLEETARVLYGEGTPTRFRPGARPRGFRGADRCGRTSRPRRGRSVCPRRGRRPPR
jgi:hypothetical protein